MEHLQSLVNWNVHKQVSRKKRQANLKTAILPFSNGFIEWEEVFHRHMTSDEDAGVLGLSILSGAHLELVADVRQLMRQERVDDVTMVVGGTIPADDWDTLRGFGVAAIFTPGTNMAEILRFFAGTFDEENP